MPASITSVTPNAAAPGTQVTILGTGFDSTSIAWFATGATQAPDPNTVLVSPTQMTAIVPDQFDGVAVPAMLMVISQLPGAAASNSVPFSILPTPTEGGFTPLCSLADYKAAFGLDDEIPPTLERQIKFWIGVASAQIAGYCRTSFSPVVITNELYDGDGTDMLTLKSSPILSLQAVTVDTVALDVSTLRAYREYIRFYQNDMTNPFLGQWAGIFPEGTQNIAVSYTAGYTTVPADLAGVMPLQVGLLMNTFNKQGLSTETNNTVNATSAYDKLPIVPIVQQCANRYRMKGIRVI
jgi:hypothetical protein